MSNYCTNCGASVEANTRFCRACGTAAPVPQSSPQADFGRPPSGAQLPVATVAVAPRTEHRSTASNLKSKNAALFWGAVAAIAVVVAAGVFFFVRSRRAASDAAIAQNIKAAFLADEGLRRCSIDITARDGVVTLAGITNDDADKTNAVRVARQQQGVVQVVDEITLSSGSPSSEAPKAPVKTTEDVGAGVPSNGQTGRGEATTVTVPANQAWTATGSFVNPGDVVVVSASGNVSMGGGWPPMPPMGRPPNCGGRSGFPAGQLPCWSLIGRIGENGEMFYVGSKIAFRASLPGQLFLGVNDDNLGDNSSNWTATVLVGPNSTAASTIAAPNPATGDADRAGVVQAVVEDGDTSLQLQPGRMYLFAMDTGGALPSGAFANEDYTQVNDAAGNLAAAIAYGLDDQNTYTTQTWAHTIGGVSVAGYWDDVKVFRGVNSQPGASSASANFAVSEDSLVVIIALAGGESNINIAPLPGLTIDAFGSGGPGKIPMTIAHAYLKPGAYTATELTSAAGDLDPRCMADLIGVFVFGERK